MSGHHASRGSNWKLWVLVIALVVVVAAVAFLLVNSLLGGILLGGQSSDTTSTGLATQVSVQDAKGKDVTDKVSIAEGTQRPDSVDADAELVLISTAWAGKRSVNTPVIVTVTDSRFTNEDGLAVYAYVDYAWQEIGTYLIVDHSVSFQVDELTNYAFQVISSQPTPTPEPTPSPTPEPTPEPVEEEVIDYGTYSQVVEGLFIEATGMTQDGTYVIAVLDGAAAADDSGVTFFDANSEDESTLTASVLLNYDGEQLRTVETEIGQTADGRYYIIDPVVEGMLWQAVDSDTVMSATRFALSNNEKFLNLDDDNANVILNDNADRTRWLYGTVEVSDGDDFNTLSYAVSPDLYYANELKMVDTQITETEGEQTTESSLTFTVTTDDEKALTFVIFRLSTDTEDVDTDTVTGTLVLTTTPDSLTGLDATPAPTATPDSTGGLTPSTGTTTAPTPVPTAPVATETPATQPPEETLAPPAATDTPVASTGSDATTGGNDNSGTTGGEEEPAT
jgi:hypothetical protein